MKKRCVIRTYLLLIFTFLAVGCGEKDIVSDNEAGEIMPADRGKTVSKNEKGGNAVSEEAIIVESENEQKVYLSDVELSDISITEVDLEAWGTVNLVSGTYNARHPYPCFYLTNEKNEILYDAGTSCGPAGWRVWDIFPEDIDNDGMKDLVAVTCATDDAYGGRCVSIFYQDAYGAFEEKYMEMEDLSELYYGDYRIARFCPTGDYPEHAEEWLTQQEADSMVGRIVEIKEKIMVTYDSERRRGTRGDRREPQSNNEVMEYRPQTRYIPYNWMALTSEMLQNCSVTDDTMKEAVGEEYYEKVNGVFICCPAAIQWFFTLDGEDSLIMYSLLSKQYFILEKQATEWKGIIYVPVDDYRGNILGYTLGSDGDGSSIWYERDLDYLLEESVVGNGVFVSEHMYGTEAFIGTLLKEILAQRGEIGENRRKYFTEEAERTLKETDWSLLDEEWEVTPYSYGASYTLNHVSGEAGYDFFYAFEPDGTKITREETQNVSVGCSINSRGIIYNIWVCFNNVPTKSLGPENEVSLTEGLFRKEQYTERIITDGYIDEGKVLLDYSVFFKRGNPDYQQENCRLLVSGDAALSAAGLKELLFCSMNGEDEAVSQYASPDVADLKRITWEDLGEGWIPGEMYDCYYIDEIKLGYVSFDYYFYPDYTAMGVEEANVAVVSCRVGAGTGYIYGNSLRVVPMTQWEYEAARERRGSERRLLVDKGTVLSGRAAVAIPIPNEPLVHMPLSEYQVKEAPEEHYTRKTAGELWGFQDAADVASYLGDKFLRDFDARDIGDGEIDEICVEDEWRVLGVIKDLLWEDWMPDRRYDCYYIMENECAGCMHLQYYFYSQETDDMKQRSGKAAVVDVYLSEEGIEDVQVSII